MPDIVENDPGYLYLVKMGGQGIYKIGKSVDVQKRLTQFGIQPPFPYQLIYARRVNSVGYREQLLHKTYRNYRLNGEWFRLSPGQVHSLNLHLLTWQAEALIDRTAWLLAELSHVADEGKLTRLFRILLSAKRRMARRVDAYFAASLDMVGDDTNEVSDVLDAEVVC